MLRFTVIGILHLSLVICASMQAKANSLFNNLTIYTEHNPPFNFHEAGELKGSSIEVLLEIFKRLDVQKGQGDFIISPWARGYSETKRRPNTMLFATVRTPMREDLFKWVGPISATQLVLFASAQNDIEINNTRDLNRYRYGVSKDSRGEQIMLEAGTHQSRIIHVNSHASAITMLSRGRYDAWVRDITSIKWTATSLGFDLSDFKTVYEFDANHHYFAFHKETNPTILSLMQETLDEMERDGTLLAINQKYFGMLAPKN